MTNIKRNGKVKNIFYPAAPDPVRFDKGAATRVWGFEKVEWRYRLNAGAPPPENNHSTLYIQTQQLFLNLFQTAILDCLIDDRYNSQALWCEAHNRSGPVPGSGWNCRGGSWPICNPR